MRCDYFDAAVCRSCTLLGRSYAEQLADKERHARHVLREHPDLVWLPPVTSPEEGFRNKAKMVVGGTVDAPTVGILDAHGRGVDLRRCGLHTPAIRAALPSLAELVTRARLAPYDVPARRGELKHVLVTESPDGELMVRFVLRSTESLDRIRKHLPWLVDRVPSIAVASVNVLPEHKAVLEGEREILLTERTTLPMRLGGVVLRLRPQGFFQTNTTVAEQVYAQASAWVDAVTTGTASTGTGSATRGPAGSEVGAPAPVPAATAVDGPRRMAAVPPVGTLPRHPAGAPAAGAVRVWDLYCGVGGFALHCAGPGRDVVGVEVSADAVRGAQEAAHEAGLTGVRFVAGDATAYALARAPHERPDVVVVNPPRRGIGAELADWLERSGVPHVVYSSCNVESLARDLRVMPSLAPVEGRLLDMFPQTTHYEVMVRLERRA